MDTAPLCLISFYNKKICEREYYLNRSAFTSITQALGEIRKIKWQQKIVLEKMHFDAGRCCFLIEPVKKNKLGDS